uniref:Uncharacterized protein n=1 Tax=Rhizophora mucronata TaxID=61149 RepID=A0A2P2NFR3_RHIMU
MQQQWVYTSQQACDRHHNLNISSCCLIERVSLSASEQDTEGLQRVKAQGTMDTKIVEVNKAVTAPTKQKGRVTVTRVQGGKKQVAGVLAQMYCHSIKTF